MVEQAVLTVCSLRPVFDQLICIRVWLFIAQDMEMDFDMKALVDKVLNEAQCTEKRARVMDIDDFMRLLYTFNKYNVHFT